MSAKPSKKGSIEDRISQSVVRETADSASRFAFDHRLTPAAEARLHNLLKDVALFGLDQGTDLAIHYFDKEN